MIQFGVIARNFSSSSAVQSAIKNVTVIGGGLMGSGIAQVWLVTFMRNQSVYMHYYPPFETRRFLEEPRSPT